MSTNRSIYLTHMIIDIMESLQTNFILLSYPRSGSTLLSLSLGSHRHIKMYLELFHHNTHARRSFFRADKHVIGPEGQSKTRSNARYYRAGERGDQFLQEAVYYDRNCEKPLAVGFKLFYNHARDDKNMKATWDFVIQRKDIRVIHLIRRNLLDAKLSSERAKLTGQWAKHIGTPSTPCDMAPLILDPVDCQRSFNQVLAHRAWVTRAFSDHPFLELVYEDHLSNRLQDTMLMLQGFLSVPSCKTKVLTEKQSTLPTYLQIANYDELREYFRHTIHQTYFTD